ncbi:nicotinate-nucleotide--dimethylbenzimidazole phosphoribosyltransferase [Nocardiopsis coralliicola]
MSTGRDRRPHADDDGDRGGLLDGLPESGRSASPRTDPFTMPPARATPAADRPNVIPFRGAPPAPEPPAAPEAPAPPRAEPQQAPPAPAPPPSTAPEPGPPPEPPTPPQGLPAPLHGQEPAGPEPERAPAEPPAAPPAPEPVLAPAPEAPPAPPAPAAPAPAAPAAPDPAAPAAAPPAAPAVTRSEPAPPAPVQDSAAPSAAAAPAAAPAEPAAQQPAAAAPAAAAEPAESGPGAAAGGADPAPHAPKHADVHAFTQAERDAVYRAIRDRRDVRVGFRPDPVPDEVLTRVLEAAHQAPSVGFSQPWDFVVVTDTAVRTEVQRLARARRDDSVRDLPAARARAFSGTKVEAVLDAPVNIAVTVDPTRGGRHALGRHAQPQTASHAGVLAVENLWLAARAEGLGTGWVGAVETRALAGLLDLPPHLEVVAYLCLGYVDEFPTEPELALGGWARHRPLSWAVHRDHYGQRGLPGEKATSLLDETVSAIRPLDAAAVQQAADRQSNMTKPPGSLGVLEEVAVRLAGLAGECPAPVPEPASVAVFAGDHGVHAQGVTGWPQEVTAQMVQTMLSGRAVTNAFAAQVGAEVAVVDVGVLADLPPAPGLVPRKIARGTADITRAPAMTRSQAAFAIEAGIEVARDLVSSGSRCLITGDMGIGNTTPAAALIAAFTGADPAECTGRGTGVDDAVHEHKIGVVRQALALHRPDPSDPVGVLAAVGGLEHAALTGFILGAAALRVPVLLDGVIAGSASLAAAALAPESMRACFAGHRSVEPGHTAVLEHTGLRALVDLDLRLGEGSGALLALPMLQSAARAQRDVASFADAGVTQG